MSRWVALLAKTGFLKDLKESCQKLALFHAFMQIICGCVPDERFDSLRLHDDVGLPLLDKVGQELDETLGEDLKMV